MQFYLGVLCGFLGTVSAMVFLMVAYRAGQKKGAGK